MHIYRRFFIPIRRQGNVHRIFFWRFVDGVAVAVNATILQWFMKHRRDFYCRKSGLNPEPHFSTQWALSTTKQTWLNPANISLTCLLVRCSGWPAAYTKSPSRNLLQFGEGWAMGTFFTSSFTKVWSMRTVWLHNACSVPLWLHPRDLQRRH